MDIGTMRLRELALTLKARIADLQGQINTLQGQSGGGGTVNVSIPNPLPVSQSSGPWSVTVSNWPTTQPVSVAGSVAVTGPLTDTQLRATAIPVSGTIAVSNFPATQPVSGTVAVSNLPATQPVSIAATVGVSGPLTDTQLRASAVPVSLASTTVSGTVAVSGPITDTQLRASAVPVSLSSTTITGTAAVSGTFWQATQPVSIASMPSTPVTGTFWQATQPVSIAATLNVAQSGTWNVGTVTTLTSITNAVSTTAPTLTKGTQGTNGWSVQALKDAGRSSITLVAEFTMAQVAETMLSLSKAVDGGAPSSATSFTITSGKKLRLQSISMEVESLGSGTAPQRAYLRLRRNTAGATVVGSNLIGVWSCCNNTAIVKSAAFYHYEIPDSYEMSGDGTATFGFSLETPDWVTTTATGRVKITIIGFEY